MLLGSTIRRPEYQFPHGFKGLVDFNPDPFIQINELFFALISSFTGDLP
jgi:hypothetical protein